MSQIDINEYLFLKQILNEIVKNANKVIRLSHLASISNFDENFFISTLKKMEKKKLVQIGFYRKTQVLQFANWDKKFYDNNEYYIGLTKNGKNELDKW